MLFRSVLSSDDRQRRRWQFVRACDGMSPLNFRSREYKERRRERETEMDAGSRSPSRLYEIAARLAALPSSHWVACGVRMDWTDADTGLPLPDRAGETQTLKGAEAHSLVHRQPQPHRRLFIWPCSSLCDYVSASIPNRLRQLVKPENTLLLPFAFLLLPSLDPPANELQLTPPAHPSSARSLPLPLLPPSINLYAPIIPLCEKRSKTALPPPLHSLHRLSCSRRRIQFHTFEFPLMASCGGGARVSMTLQFAIHRSTQNGPLPFPSLNSLSLPDCCVFARQATGCSEAPNPRCENQQETNTP